MISPCLLTRFVVRGPLDMETVCLHLHLESDRLYYIESRLYHLQIKSGVATVPAGINNELTFSRSSPEP